MDGCEMSMEQVVQAHQYLYYVLSRPVLSDFDYDMLCRQHEIDGGGGSDCESHYTPEVKALAEDFLRRAGRA